MKKVTSCAHPRPWTRRNKKSPNARCVRADPFQAWLDEEEVDSQVWPDCLSDFIPKQEHKIAIPPAWPPPIAP